MNFTPSGRKLGRGPSLFFVDTMSRLRTKCDFAAATPRSAIDLQ